MFMTLTERISFHAVEYVGSISAKNVCITAAINARAFLYSELLLPFEAQLFENGGIAFSEHSRKSLRER